MILHWKKIGDFGQALKNKLERNLVIGFGKIEFAEIFGNNRFGKKLLRNQQNFIKMKLAKFVPVSVKLGFIFGKIGPFFHHILGEKQLFLVQTCTFLWNLADWAYFAKMGGNSEFFWVFSPAQKTLFSQKLFAEKWLLQKFHCKHWRATDTKNFL